MKKIFEMGNDLKILFFVLPIAWLIVLGPGSIDGAINPAASQAEITSTRLGPLGQWTEFDGKTERLRPECSFREIRWYLGTRGGKNVPAPVVLEPPMLRPDGAFDFYNWKVQVVPPETFYLNTFADVYHQCSYFGIQMPFWTKTRFWR